MVYVPLGQYWDFQSIRVVMRAMGPVATLAADVRERVSRIDRATPVTEVHSYSTQIGETIARPRFAAYLLGAFAIITVFLAAVGAYGVLSQAVSRRIREIGVRLAFGANGRSVFGLLFRHGMALTIVGVAIGVPAAAASTTFLSALLFGVESPSRLVFAGVSGVLLLVGVCVSYVPARRAARVDPMVALRWE
jgi:ABC-type antimicrobial peptide transport system permease subunit